jgi:hypothetical protein
VLKKEASGIKSRGFFFDVRPARFLDAQATWSGMFS